MIAGFDFEKKEIHRDTTWTYPRTGSRWRNRAEKCQDELRSASQLSLFRAIVTSAEIDIVARRAYCDRHESGQPTAD